MVQLRSVLKSADNSGAKKLRVFHIYGGSRRVLGFLGCVVHCSVIESDSNGLVKTGEKVKAVIVRTAKEHRRMDGSYIRFDDNAAVIIDPSTKEPKGTRVFGPVAREVKEAGFNRIASLAPEVL